MERAKRIICMVLCFAMLAGYLPAPVYAEDLSQQGLCEHHTEHIGCSYSPAVEEQTCQHQCSDACYTKEEACQHTHDGCETGDTPCDHVCSEGNGCITKKLACAHEHDEACGYAAPKDAAACDYVCTDCKKQDELVNCDGTLSCEAKAHSETCEKKISDDMIAAEQAANEKAAAEQAAADQAAADAVASLIDALPSLEEIHYASAIGGSCGDPNINGGKNVIWEFDETTGILTISGNGAMANYSGSDCPWYSYRNAIKKVDIKQGVTTIGNESFYFAMNMKEVVIPNSVTSIGKEAFKACSGLQKIAVPQSVTQIGEDAFLDCSSLVTIHITDLSAWLRIIPGSGDSMPTAANTSDKQLILNGEILKNVTIPTGITRIPNHAFYRCADIDSVSIPDGLTEIGYHAFEKCRFRNVTLPESITSIGGHAFALCSNLENINIPSKITIIEDYVFTDCEKLREVSIPTGVTKIGQSAFKWCKGIEMFVLPVTVKTVMDDAFAYSTIQDLYYGGTAEQHSALGTYRPLAVRFHPSCIDPKNHWTTKTVQPSCVADGYTVEICKCTNPKERNKETIATNGEHYYVNGVCSGCQLPEGLEYTISNNEVTITNYTGTATSIVIPATIEGCPVTIIGLNAFSDSRNLMNIQIPESVASIESYAFHGCSSLSRIIIPEGVTTIGSHTFDGCTNLTSITIPGSITHIGSNAFFNCSAMEQITFLGDVPQLEGTIFSAGAVMTAFYPYGNDLWTEAVRSTFGDSVTWYRCDEDGYALEGSCGENVVWLLDPNTGVLTISGSGAMNDYSLVKNPAPWHHKRAHMQGVIIAEDVIHIGTSAFQRCTNLSSVELSDKTVSIGNYAFSDCSSLQNIMIPECVEAIGTRTFANCTSLTAVTIPKDVYRIEDAAFSGCTSLKAITFMGDSPTIAEDAFTGVTATAYYPVGWNWYEGDFSDYGGELTWEETGVEAKKLTVSLTETMAPGMKIQNYVSVRPWNAKGEYTVSVSNPDVLEFVSIENDYIEICALQPGTSTVTVKELRSGLEYSGEVTVVEPQVVFSPCSMSLQVPEGDSVRYLSFVPEVTGTYQFSVSTIEHLTLSYGGYGGYGGSIYILNQGEWVESTLRGDDDMKNLLADLNAGTFYIIGVPFYLSAYEQTALFTIEQVGDNAGTDGTILQFYQEHENVEYMPGEDQHHYLSVNYNGSNPLTWKSSNPSILEIEDVYTENDYCKYKINGEGTAVITVSNGILSDSITITTQVMEFAELYLPKTVTSEENDIDRCFGFVAPEAGRYAFAVSTDDGSVTMGFNHWSDEFNIMFSYGESSCTGFRTMEAGEVCQFYVMSDQPTCTIRVSKASATPLSMKIAVTSQNGNLITFGANFTPANACDRVVKWEIDNREIAAENSNPDMQSISNSSRMTYEVYEEGTLTVTAVSESGLKASFTMEVHPGLCKENHTYGNWMPILDENGEQTGRERRQCEYCDVYQERKMPPIDETVENRVVIDATEMTGQNTVWIDGVEYVLQRNSNKCYVDLPDGNARTMVTYTYSSTVQNRYPVGMKVWTLENIDGIYTANRQESFDDILQYSGMSIRVTGKKGIRMVTGIEQDKKNALISGGLEGYTLKEYGTVVAWASKLTDVNPLTLGQSYAMSNYAYKKGVADPVFAYSGSLMQYTNVLVNFSDEQCKYDLALRPYMILEDENGENLTLYGGILQRSIGYIAYQNRNTFEPQTEEYNYIWDIIHYVYGDVHDDEFIHAWTPITK